MHEWQDGELITAQKLNALEEAVAGAATAEAFNSAIKEELKNVGATQVGAVSYKESQTTLSDDDKRKALANINAVGYLSQQLTTDQQEQARRNIGAISSAELGSDITSVGTNTQGTGTFPLIVANTDNITGPSNIKTLVANNSSNRPTVNLSTGIMNVRGINAAEGISGTFSGDGSNITNLDLQHVKNNSILPVSHGGTGVDDLSKLKGQLGGVDPEVIAPDYDKVIADGFDENKYCTRNGKFYRSNKVIAPNADWSFDDWNEITLANLIQSLDQTVANVSYGVFTSTSDGLVPSSGANADKFLKGNGTWGTPEQYTLPTASDEILGGVKVGDGLTIANDGTLSANVQSVPGMIGATTSTDGTAGLVPAPLTTDLGKFLSANGNWKEVVTDLTDVNNKIADAIKNIADEYDASKTYNANDYCIYGNKLYVCTQEATGEFDSEKWEEANVVEAISEISSKLTPEAIGAASASDLANEYNSATAYKEGDYCIYNAHLYKCKTDVTGTAPTNSTYWEPTTVDAAMALAAQAAAASASGIVRYDTEQNLGEAKAVARANIGAADANIVAGLTTSVSSLNSAVNNLSYVKTVSQNEGKIRATYNDDSYQEYATGIAFNGGYVNDNNDLYFTYRANQSSEAVPVPGVEPIHLPATGGGGGAATSTISLTNPVRTTTVRNGKPCPFSFTITSSDDSEISVTWSVNGTVISTQNGNSGDTYAFDAKDYLIQSRAGQPVKMAVTSAGGGSLTRSWNVETVAFEINWGGSIEPIMLYTTDANVNIPIIVSAENGVETTVTVKVGSTTAVTRNIVGARTISVELNSQLFTTGVNTITATMASASDPTDKADDISIMAIWGYGATSPIVSFANKTQSCAQYDVVRIRYFVYDPNNEIATCTIKVGSQDARQVSVGRELNIYEYTSSDIGSVNIVLTCGTVSDTMTLTITQSDYNLDYIREGLKYNVDPVGHSNADSDRASFGKFTFSENFDWVNGGFKQDSSGASAFVIKKGSYITLPNSLFIEDDAPGKTIDLSFKITNSEQYDAIAIKDLNSDDTTQATKGIILHANNGEIRLGNAVGQEFRYCEESRIDMSILVEAAGAKRLMTIWLDGIPSKVNEYAANMLVYNEPNISATIGSEYCDIWIYNIRTYNLALSKRDMIQNYISNGNTTDEKVSRYIQNSILNQNDQITKTALHAAVPNLTLIEIQMPRMTYSKSDNVPSTVIITDGTTELELPALTGTGDDATGTVVKVQGTSSAAYGRSSYNLDIDFTKTDKKYKISENSIPVNYLNIKVNVASSENANNINAVDWYNTYQPYLLPYRNTTGIRDTVEGKPCAVFVTNNGNEDKWFSSQHVRAGETILYAMGDLCNSKKNKKVFAQSGAANAEDTTYTKACIEVSGNDTEPQRFRSMTGVSYNAAKEEWQSTEIEDGQQKTIKHFEWRMKPSSSDLNEVVTAWNNTVNWVISTIGNSAKFKNEVGNYFSIQSLLYHFLFIEYFAAYDNVSKNTFYSYDYDPTAGKYLWNINKAYDMDTILAADNDGKPLGDYGKDYGDTENGRSLFNAVDNPIWANIKEAFGTELSNLYTTLRSNGAWNSANIIAKWDNYQSKRPHAAMVVDAYNKYILPYKTEGVDLGDNEVEPRGSDASYLPRLQGSKTYWRRQFLTYQTSYMDGKYLVGTGAKGSAINFRTNCESSTHNFEVKAYAKTYITAIVDDNKVGSIKVNAGDTITFNNVSVGANTTLYFAPERLIQYVKPLNTTLNSTFGAAGAVKLMEANLGGESVNNIWPSGTGVSIPSVLLKDLSIRNMTNFTDSLNLSANVELKTLDTRGTKAGIITLPDSAPLTSVQLNACTGIYAHNLNNVQTFTMERGDNLISVQYQNCNKVTSDAIATYLAQAAGVQSSVTRRIRAIDVDWDFENIDTIYRIATKWRGYNALGNEQAVPVITGNINVYTMSLKKLEAIHAIWGQGSLEDSLDTQNKVWTSENLTIHYEVTVPYYAITFKNYDGSILKDKNGADYIQYIDTGDKPYDPIEAGEMNQPTYTDDKYDYTFTGWDTLQTVVTAARDVFAVYTSQIHTYTVTWFEREGGAQVLVSISNIEYGTGVDYPGQQIIDAQSGEVVETRMIPIRGDAGSQQFYVFLGWDKSTSYITSDLNVYANWDYTNGLPSTSTELKDMKLSEIYGVTYTYKNDPTSLHNYITDGSYYDIQVGFDPAYSNVTSQTLISTPTYFNGTDSSIMVFDGRNSLPEIKLFDENAPSFTLAIDYEFVGNNNEGCLISNNNMDGDAAYGFRLRQENGNPNVMWGTTSRQVGTGNYRNMLVIRHNQGESTTYQLLLNYHNLTDSYADTDLSDTIARSTSSTANGYLTFGGSIRYNTSNNTWVSSNLGMGWIYWSKIWYQDLGENDSASIARWPHETWRMEYAGLGKQTDEYTRNAAEFFLNAPLPLKHGISNLTSSSMKNFMNKIYSALPIGWQAIIKDVAVKQITSYNGSSPVVTTSSNKIYIPALIEANYSSGVNSELSYHSTNNPTYIHQLADNQDRIRFPGIINDGFNYITRSYMDNGEAKDPTHYANASNLITSGKTVWIRTDTISDPDSYYSDSTINNIGYIFFNSDYCNKHTIICGKNKNDSSNIDATGVNFTGGKWILASSWQLRTLMRGSNDDSSTYYNRVKINGSTDMNWYDQYSSSNNYNINFCFTV